MQQIDQRLLAALLQSLGALRDSAIRITSYYEGVRAGVERAGGTFVEPWGVDDLRTVLATLDKEALRALQSLTVERR